MQDISPGLGSSPLTVGVELLQLFEVYRGRHSIADSRDINLDEKSNLDKHCVVHISPRSGLKSPCLPVYSSPAISVLSTSSVSTRM